MLVSKYCPPLYCVLLALLAASPSYAAESARSTWTVPVEIIRNRILVPLTINENTQPRRFLLDTGYGVNMIHPSLVQELNLERVGSVDILGIAGVEEAGTYEGVNLRIGKTTYAPRRIASLPSEAKRKRHEDGILGSGFFRQYVIEIDAAAKVIRLHDPRTFTYRGSGEILRLDFPKDTPVIDAKIIDPHGKAIPARLEIDTGCDGPMCLGSHFVRAHNLVEKNEETKGGIRSGVGGGTRVRYGQVDKLSLGRFTVENPRTSFFMEGSPTDETQAGHIGMPALLQFKVIFDYARKRMILEERKDRTAPAGE